MQHFKTCNPQALLLSAEVSPSKSCKRNAPVTTLFLMQVKEWIGFSFYDEITEALLLALGV